jgi:adenine-specific DNA methylase
MTAMTPAVPVTPFSLKDAPSLIEKAWPAGKISFETQKERKAGSGQTLTGLGSYWKGRKPLILTRACLLGALLPATDDLEKDVAIFEALMGIDAQGMARRLPASKRDLLTHAHYGEQVAVAKRPEELPEEVLLEGIWESVNEHLGTRASSINELVEQLGIIRYGRKPKFAETFCGSGSIAFEAARVGCDVYASDLNPVACMLTWGAFNIVGAAPEEHARMKAEQEAVVAAIDKEICELGIEHDAEGNRAKVYLYCLETRCPRTGYRVPMAPSWVISKKRNVIARLTPNPAEKRYDIEILSGVSDAEVKAAEQGTVRKGRLYHPVLNDALGIEIKEIRGDHRGPDGKNRNKLRQWEKSDFVPRPDDIYQERLYAIQWMAGDDLKAGKSRVRTWFAAPSEADMQREARVEALVREQLADWQVRGLVPDMAIEPGYNTSQPIRERGWTHWHHLFNSRHLVVNATAAKHAKSVAHLNLGLAGLFNRNSGVCHWMNTEEAKAVFYNQALNTFYNYPVRGWRYCAGLFELQPRRGTYADMTIKTHHAKDIEGSHDIIVTDPPYGDAVQYDEITEFFIAWLRKNPPALFDQWVWDSRRKLAIKGEGQSFKVSMVEAYQAMTRCLSDNGLQIVQFTHQGGEVWADMAHIFWGAGLQVVNNWYVSTETSSELKKGGYIQGTHNIVLKKRQGELSGYSDEIIHDIRDEVIAQLDGMVAFNEQLKSHGRSDYIYSEADLQMAGYIAALRVITAYTRIDGMDMTLEAMKPRAKGEKTVVDELITFAARVANEHLVPEGFPSREWEKLNNTERFYLRMLDLEAAGAAKLDHFQNFAKAFRLEDFTTLMASVRPNQARLMNACELGRKLLSEEGEFGNNSPVRLALYGAWKLHKEIDTQELLDELREIMTGYHEKRELIIAVAHYVAEKRDAMAEGRDEASAARVLADLVAYESV